MEENKEIKKKKMPLYLIAIAIVLAVLGVMDLKVNAAELYGTNVYIFHDMYNGSSIYEQQKIQYSYAYESSSPMTVYLMEDISAPSSTYIYVSYFVVSDSVITRTDGNQNYETFIDKDGNTKYVATFGYTRTYARPYTARIYMTSTGAEEEIKLKQYYTIDEFITNYQNGSLNYDKPPINYDEFEIDNDMLVVEDLKRNIIENNISNGIGLDGSVTSEVYDYITWTNTSQVYQLQLQTVPVVQYYKVLAKNTFVKEFVGEWETQEIFETITNSYTKGTDLQALAQTDPNAWVFYSECGEKYSESAFENRFLYFGYRLRYVDVENMKAGPWVVIMPSNTKDSYNGYIGYSDDTTEDIGNSDGVHNEYSNMEDIEDAKEDIKTENEFKDKYDIIDGDADVGEITNWLNSVTSFIKSSPSVIGSVLSFLPQPILYGLYITIFLGVFATAVGIIKALI